MAAATAAHFGEPPPNGSPIHPKPVAKHIPPELRLDAEATTQQQQRLDRYCAASDVEVGANGLSCAIGTGTVLATRGYDAGAHYWECTCAEAGWFSFVGVSTKYPCDEAEVRRGYALPENDGGFCFAGASADARTGGCGCDSGAWHAGCETTARFPLFGAGDRLGLLLDADCGSLALYVNGSFVGEAFCGLLRCSEFFPAFAGSGQETHFVDIAFDLPLPPDTAG